MNAFDRHADVLLSRYLDAQEHHPDCRSEDCEGQCLEDEERDEQLDEWREELREERREW